jgi:hypothetical protein
MKNHLLAASALLLAASLLAPAGYSQASAGAKSSDAQGCTDSPFMARVAGSTLTRCALAPDSALQVASGKDSNGLPVEKTVTGRQQDWE